MNAEVLDVADRLHSTTIHLLRRLRREDRHASLSAARLSALSVIVFGGPLSLQDLADAEQVRPPTMSRLVTSLEKEGLVARSASEEDARITLITSTTAGKDLLETARQRRITRLAGDLSVLTSDEQVVVGRAADLLARVLRSSR